MYASSRVSAVKVPTTTGASSTTTMLFQTTQDELSPSEGLVLFSAVQVKLSLVLFCRLQGSFAVSVHRFIVSL